MTLFCPICQIFAQVGPSMNANETEAEEEAEEVPLSGAPAGVTPLASPAPPAPPASPIATSCCTSHSRDSSNTSPTDTHETFCYSIQASMMEQSGCEEGADINPLKDGTPPREEEKKTKLDEIAEREADPQPVVSASSSVASSAAGDDEEALADEGVEGIGSVEDPTALTSSPLPPMETPNFPPSPSHLDPTHSNNPTIDAKAGAAGVELLPTEATTEGSRESIAVSATATGTLEASNWDLNEIMEQLVSAVEVCKF